MSPHTALPVQQPPAICLVQETHNVHLSYILYSQYLTSDSEVISKITVQLTLVSTTSHIRLEDLSVNAWYNFASHDNWKFTHTYRSVTPFPHRKLQQDLWVNRSIYNTFLPSTICLITKTFLIRTGFLWQGYHSNQEWFYCNKQMPFRTTCIMSIWFSA